MPPPTEAKAVQQLLGFVNYLAKILPHLSDVCEPLHRLTNKDVLWAWLPQHDDVLEQIKKVVSNQPILRYYDLSEVVTLQCDASDKGSALAEGAAHCICFKDIDTHGARICPN
jgi:hypothetical protein